MTETNNNGAHNPVADGYRRGMSDFALALTGLAAAYVGSDAGGGRILR